jgi:hypothetical protein
MTLFLKKYADQIGIAASGLCLVHCLLMPFVLAFWLQTEHCSPGAACEHPTGVNYDYLFIALSAVAVWLASGHCFRPWLKALMWGFFALLAGGVLLEPMYEGAHNATIFAALGLAATHVLNWRFCRQCNPPQHV